MLERIRFASVIDIYLKEESEAKKELYEAIDETSEEEQTELIDQLSQFHLQVDELSQKSMYVSETQVNFTPLSTSQTVTTNQQLDVANTRTGRTCSQCQFRRNQRRRSQTSADPTGQQQLKPRDHQKSSSKCSRQPKGSTRVTASSIRSP